MVGQARRVTREHPALVGLGLALLALCFRATIRGDGVGYYSYLPSLVARRSFDVGPAFNRFIAIGTPVQTEFLHTHLASSLTADYKPIGAALLAVPFYLLTHLLFLAVPGYQDPTIGAEYQLAFTAASLFYAVLAAYLIYRVCRKLWGTRAAILATVGAIFATPMVAYIFFEPAYSHNFSVFATTAFALYLYETQGDRRPHQWLLAGLLGGVAMLTHAQEVLFLALVPAEAAWRMIHRSWSPRLLPGYGIFAGGVLLASVPQLAVDRAVFLRWLPTAAPNISFDVSHPHLLSLLFSTHHGWLSWSPLVAVSLLGTPLVVRRLKWFGAGLGAIGVAELFVNASLSDWWGGLGFGSRRLTDQTLLVALSLAAVCAWLLERRFARLATILVTGGVGWTVLLLAQYYYIIRHDAGPPWPAFLLGQLQAIRYVPRLFIQGTVVRDAATGQLLMAAYSAVVVVAVLAGALWLGERLPLQAFTRSPRLAATPPAG